MVLIFSNRFDQSTNNVMDWLNYMGQEVVRINGDENRYSFQHIDSTGIYYKASKTGEIININDARLRLAPFFVSIM